jgi:hypothetical protein
MQPVACLFVGIKQTFLGDIIRRKSVWSPCNAGGSEYDRQYARVRQ